MTQTPPLHLGRALDLLDEEMPRWLKSFNLRIEVHRPPGTRYYWRLDVGGVSIDVDCLLVEDHLGDFADETLELHVALYKAWVLSLADVWHSLDWWDQDDICIALDWPERVADGEHGMDLPAHLVSDLAQLHSTEVYG